MKEGDPRGTFIVLDGCLSSRSDRGGAVRVVRELEAGTITGVLPYSRLKTPSVYIVAVGAVEMLLVDESDIPDMIRECHAFTTVCVHEMVDRTRVFRSYDLHQEKMAALGRLSAGLAHELGNPSSAIGRSAGRLEQAQFELVEAARDLGAVGLEGQSASALEALEVRLAETPEEPLSSLDLADREDVVGDWLTAHGVDEHYAYTLASGTLTEADLDAASAALGKEELQPVLRFLAARIEARQIADEISGAASRVHTLVDAVKKHTHMDRAPVVEPIPLADHLASTVTLVEAKALARSITVELDVEPGLPNVAGVVSDLNHVWINLIDNAIDAVGESGCVRVSARRDGACVVVDVVDDGEGIAAEDRDRLFDPFFTTKGVGEGAGLGLDVVRTIVESHKGSVGVDPEPGQTKFWVRLPLAVTPGKAS